jgi:hypothetical protein
MRTNYIQRLKSKASVLLKYKYINFLRGVPLPDVTGENAQKSIASAILSGRKLVARVGSVEAGAVAFYLKNRFHASAEKPYPEELRRNLKLSAGFFPCTDQYIDELCRLYLNSISEIDLYAAWNQFDRALMPKHVTTCRLHDLDPFFTKSKWTLSLEKRRVTVISPFKKTILEQYKRHTFLFAHNTIPDMNLSVIQAPQTHCNQDVEGQDWFQNLNLMKQEIKESASEVLVIGAGAYGLPLGAYAKNIGASAVVLGGATQLLFGIIGSRWENDRQYRQLFNEYWCRPSIEERPIGFQNCEINGGAYW